ncbi:uncharacterized protein LOC135082457 [Ostrinia nubilalis]|uniref:uncharacterized protein LOC135082457 n=1 Tax=Ostrinia nubilalis TaxID=29057 RepID=UPI0030824285
MQQGRVLWCLEETVSRPLLRAEEAWQQTQELALALHSQEYVDKQGRVLWCLEETVSRPLLRAEEAWQQTQELAFALHSQEYVDKMQQGRVLWCLEETVSRPLLRAEEAWQQTHELALALHSQEYVDKYKMQQGRVLWCLEETVSRPLLRAEEAWQQTQELALALHSQEYVDKVKTQHEAAQDFLQKITPYEDKLLTVENLDEKFKIYVEYIGLVEELAHDKKYGDCDIDGILKVLYDRATTECITVSGVHSLLKAYVRHVRACASRASYCRILDACSRRCPRRHTFWSLKIRYAEQESVPAAEVS